MKHMPFVALVAVTIPAGASAQGADDPFDLSGVAEAIGEGSTPTVESVDRLQARAMGLYSDSCAPGAIDALDEYGRMANALANIIGIGLEPFYDASLDERRDFNRTRELVPFENLANGYRRQRNEAMVMRAECLAQEGAVAEAVALYFRALQLIDIDNQELWDRARGGLYEIVGVDVGG